MLPAVRRLSCLACLVLSGVLLAGAQLRPDVTSETKPQAKATTSIVLFTDMDCAWTLDGVAQGQLASNTKSPKVVRVSPGAHNLQAASMDGKDTWVMTSVVLKQFQRMTIHVKLNEVRRAREEGERWVAARRQEEARTFTWTDPRTGLMWVRNDNGGDLDWRGAVRYCTGLDLAGFQDWRLAAKEELLGIQDRDNGFQVKDEIHLTGDYVWSSTAGDSGGAWYVTFRKYPSTREYLSNSGKSAKDVKTMRIIPRPLAATASFDDTNKRALCVRYSAN